MSNLYSTDNNIGGLHIYSYGNINDDVESIVNNKLTSYYTKTQSDTLYFRNVAIHDLNMNDFKITHLNEATDISDAVIFSQLLERDISINDLYFTQAIQDISINAFANQWSVSGDLLYTDNYNKISIGHTKNIYNLDVRDLSDNDTRIMINDCSVCDTLTNASLNIFIRENDTKEHIHLRRVFTTPSGTKTKDFGISLDEDASLTMGKYDNNGNYEELLYVSENHTIEVEGSEGGDFLIRGTPNISLSGVHSKNIQQDISINSIILKNTAQDASLNFIFNTTVPRIDASLNSLTTSVNGKVSKSGDTMTGELTIERTGDGTVLLNLNTERRWVFRQIFTGASSALSLKSIVGNKYFYIDGELDDNMVRFYALNRPATSADITLQSYGSIDAPMYRENGTPISNIYAPISHTHPTSQITGLDTSLNSLQTQINGKANTSHTHTTSQITGLDTSLNSLQTQINGKANTSHTHTTSQITGLDTSLNSLQTQINGKANTSHTHDISNLLPFINGSQRAFKFPTADMTATTTNITTGLIEGQGNYTASASSVFGTYPAWWAFDSITTSGNIGWHSGTFYNSTTGLYTGSNSIGGISGEWLKLELPTEIKVYAFSLLSRTGFSRRTPNTFQLLGSNNNTTWTSIFSQSNYTLYQDNVFQYFTVNNNTGYKYLALVIETTQNSSLAGTGEVGNIQIVEMRYYGEPVGGTVLDGKLDLTGGTLTGNLGINNTSPECRLTINPTITHRNNFNHNTAQLTIFDPNNNGGNTPNGTRDILYLVREGISGQAFGNKVAFAVGRYENVGGASRTQLDIKLNDENYTTDNTVLSLRSNGRVGINKTTPTEALDVSGNILASGNTTTTDLIFSRQLATLNGGGRSYTCRGAIGLTASASRWIGEYKFSGSFQNAYLKGHIYAQSGESYGRSDFYITLRSDALPNSSRRFYQEKTPTIYNVNTILYYDNVNTYYIGFTSSTSYQNYTWEIDIQERGNINGYTNYTEAITADISGLTQIVEETPPRILNQRIKIGTSAPTSGYSLDVDGLSILGARAEVLYNSGIAGDRLMIGTGTNKMGIRQDGHAMELTTTNNGNINLLPNGTGNVGIGTSSPSTILELAKSVSTAGDENLMIHFNNTFQSNYDWRLGSTLITDPFSNDPNPVFQLKGGANGTSLTSFITATGEGRIGIGNDDPSFKLDVNGDFRATSASITGDLNVTPTGVSYMFDLRCKNIPIFIGSYDVGQTFINTTGFQNVANFNITSKNTLNIGGNSVFQIYVQAKYSIPGSGSDNFYSRVTFDNFADSFAYGTQEFRNGAYGTGTRSGVLFPLNHISVSRPTNSGQVYNIKVQIERGVTDDSITFDAGKVYVWQIPI